MTYSQPGATATETLATLPFDPTLRHVIDEIAALRLHQPSVSAYADFIRNRPSVADMVERARLHADQVARFVALAQVSPPGQVSQHLGQLYALVLLNTTATVAVALMPATSGADRHARRQQGAAFIQSLDNPDDNELRHVGEIAFGLKDHDAHTVAQDAIAFAGRGHGEASPTSHATIHRIEDHVTLRGWLKRKADAGLLLAEARQHAVWAERFARSIDEDELHPQDRDEIAAAREGALLQHVLALAALALSPVQVDTDRIFEAAHASVATRARLQAGLIIAIAAGQHYRAMLAAHPC
ncbi:MAG: hypothetical protein K2X84_12060 [Beijerinckiaceae bacterium]|nr:hypothetical protein [Beijerinckiaceae bacterium]